MTKLKYSNCLLDFPIPDLTLEAKYVLIRVLEHYGSLVVKSTINELAQQMGMSDNLVKQAITLLGTLDYLISPDKDEKGQKVSIMRSTSIVEFQISPSKFREWHMEFADLNESLHQNKIEYLLFNFPYRPQSVPSRTKTDKPIPKRIHSGLAISNRLLLATLYQHADYTGVVHGLGLTQLGKLVGMTQPQLRLQLEKLSKTGYLLGYYSGIGGKNLFGRAKGEFFLNVLQKVDGRESDSVCLIMTNHIYIDRQNVRNGGWRLISDATDCVARKRRSNGCVHNGDIFHWSDQEPIDKNKLAEKLNQIQHILSQTNISSLMETNWENCESVPFIIENYNNSWFHEFEEFQLEEFFASSLPMFKPMVQYLQYRINAYASILLTENWSNLDCYSPDVHGALINKIGCELYPKDWRRKQDQDEGLENLIAKALGLIVFRIAFELAYLSKKVILAAFQNNDIQRCLQRSKITLMPARHVPEARPIEGEDSEIILIQFDKSELVRSRLIGIYRDPKSQSIVEPTEELLDSRDESSSPLNELMNKLGIYLQKSEHLNC